jgi:hypothetical protein
MLVIYGSEVTTATPGSMEGRHLIVDDIEAARADPNRLLGHD